MKLTLAGVPGSGKSTLRTAIAEHYSLEAKGTGDFMREIAKKYGYQDITQFLVEYVSQHPEIDYEIDQEQKRFGAENTNFVLDAHLGFYFVPDSIKIFLTCNPTIAAERIFDAKRSSEASEDAHAAFEKMQARIQAMKDNFKKLYGIDVHNESHFDYIIDTSYCLPSEVFIQACDYVDQRLQTQID